MDAVKPIDVKPTPKPTAVAGQKKRRFTFPTAFTILFVIILIVAVLTWLIPAGQYELNKEGAPIAGTYHEVASNPQKLKDVIAAPINGMYGIKGEAGGIDVYNDGGLFGAIDVAFFVLVIGGFLGVTMRTGAIDAGIARTVSRLKGREKWLIAVLMSLFAIGGTTYGMAEETIAFYPLIIPVLIAAGYDSITGVAVILLGAGIGVLGSTINPFATGIASAFAEIPLGDGIALRLLIFIALTVMTIIFVLRYAERVRKDPTRSLVYNQKKENEAHFLADANAESFPEFTPARKMVLGLFGLAFLFMIYGVIPWKDIGINIPTWGWWFPELSVNFLVFAILIGFVGRLKEKVLVNSLIDGSKDLLGVALIIAVARGVTVIMNNGLITDTVLHWSELTVAGLKEVGFANVMYWLYLPLSFLVPSTSGLATLSMPIMAPSADFANVSRHLVVTAYQCAEGWINLITPTSAVVMGGLAIGRVGYGTWWRFVWPLMVILLIVSMLFLTVGALL
jgi:uncharacterized ion transporter superfamily protein YfcC